LIRCSSDDKSKSIIENAFHPEIHFIANQTNLGSTKSFNKALKVAQGAYIDLAADDVLLNNGDLTMRLLQIVPLKPRIVCGNALINERQL
jgi:GT2 family glycosyltransferase